MTKWFRVDEVARILSLSPEMIYKLVQRGDLPAIKIETSWRIHPDELNRWIISKKNRPAGLALTPPRSQALEIFVQQLKQNYGKNLVALYVYGSVARGDADDESDIDTLVVLKTFKDRWQELRQVQKLAYASSFGKGFEVLFSVSVASESEWRLRQDPVFYRIREEGLKAA